MNDTSRFPRRVSAAVNPLRRGWAAGFLCGLGLLGAAAAAAAPDAPPPTTPADPPQWTRRRWALGDAAEATSGRAVAMLADGRLLVATERGFVRFNGHRLLPVSLGESPAPVLHLFESRSGDLHVLFKNGDHVVWDRGTLGRRDVARAAPPRRESEAGQRDLEPTSICEDAAGEIWIGHRDGFVKRVHGGRVDWLPPEDRGPDPLTRVCADAAGGVWRIEQGRLSAWRDGRFVVMTKLPPGQVALAPARRGGLWVQAGEKILHFETALCDLTTFDVGSPGSLRMLEDRSGCLWIGTSRHGLSVITLANVAAGPTKLGTSGSTIFDLVEDGEGNVWTGTTGGIERFTPTVVSRTDMPLAAPLRAIRHDAAGNLWFVTLDGRLGRERRRPDGRLPPSATRHTAVDGAADDAGAAITDATCLAAAADGGMWVGTSGRGILRCRDTSASPLPLPDDLGGQPVTALLVTRSGVLVAAVGDALAWRVGAGWERAREAVVPQAAGEPREPDPTRPATVGSRPIGTVHLLAEAADGTIWAATDQAAIVTLAASMVEAGGDVAGGQGVGDRPGVTAERPRGVFQRATPGAAAGGISGLCCLPNGSVWVASRTEGLGRFRDGRWSRLGVEHGLPSATVLAVVSDGRGRLWCSSSRRMFALGEDDAEAVADGRRNACHCWSMPGQEEATFFDPGLVPPGNAILDAAGRVLVILPTGVAVCAPDRLPAAAGPPPRVGIDEVKVDGHGVLAAATNPWSPPTDRIPRLRIPPDPRRLEVRFSERTMLLTTNVRVQHRLDGIDEEWVDSPPDRFVAYDRLPAGSRRFRVRSSTDAAIGGDDAQGLVIDVEPRLWERTGFRGGVLVAALVGGCGTTATVLRRRNRRRIDALEQLAALERERTRIARDMHDEVGTNLTQISLLARVARSRAAPEQLATLDQMAAISRQTTAAFDEIVWAINPAHDTLPHLLSYLLQRADETVRRFGIPCHLDAPAGVQPFPAPADFRRNVLLIAKEAVGNVLKHARAGQVWIGASVRDRRLVLTVRDDGVGFDAAAAGRGRSGLGNMRSRAAACGGSCRIEPVPEGGTLVIVDVPIPCG